MVGKVARRLPIVFALAATGFVLLSVSISGDPKLPLVDGWLDADDTRVAAEIILLSAVFFAVLIASSVIQNFVERGSPNRYKAIGLELDWTPEDAKELRKQYEALTSDIEQATELLRDTIRRVSDLEKR